jgi:hypothetical protein
MMALGEHGVSGPHEGPPGPGSLTAYTLKN